MYIELFLLDNALMNFLICRAAAALCGRRLRMRRAVAASAAAAVYAALAFLHEPLMSPMAKAALCAAMGGALPSSSFAEYLSATVAMFASACIIGGLAFFLSYATGGAMGGAAVANTGVRAVLIIASAAAAIPHIARRMRTMAGAAGRTHELVIYAGGARYTVNAMVDTGNMLMEPLSGLPVAVAHIHGMQVRADIPVPAATVQGCGVLYAFRPERAVFMGEELDMLIALTPERMRVGALIPPAALQRGFRCGADIDDLRGGAFDAGYHKEDSLPPVPRAGRGGKLYKQWRGAAAAAEPGGGGRADGAAGRGCGERQDDADRAQSQAGGIHRPQV